MSAQAGSERSGTHIERFDFERLERSVEDLVRDHERLSAEREALMSELLDREHRIATLEARLRDERDRRRTALEGVNRILARVESLQTSVLETEQLRGEGAEAATGGRQK